MKSKIVVIFVCCFFLVVVVVVVVEIGTKVFCIDQNVHQLRVEKNGSRQFCV